MGGLFISCDRPSSSPAAWPKRRAQCVCAIYPPVVGRVLASGAMRALSAVVTSFVPSAEKNAIPPNAARPPPVSYSWPNLTPGQAGVATIVRYTADPTQLQHPAAASPPRKAGLNGARKRSYVVSG